MSDREPSEGSFTSVSEYESAALTCSSPSPSPVARSPKNAIGGKGKVEMATQVKQRLGQATQERADQETTQRIDDNDNNNDNSNYQQYRVPSRASLSEKLEAVSGADSRAQQRRNSKGALDKSGHSINRLGLSATGSNDGGEGSASAENSRHKKEERSTTMSVSPKGKRRSLGSGSTSGAPSNQNRGGPKLSWKSDPKSSYSDCRIVLKCPNEQDKSFDLHRNIVGFGPRKSKYLAKAFDAAFEGTPLPVVVELAVPDALHIQAFPMVCDFMYYTKEVKQKLTAERACCVYKLAEQLEIQALKTAIVDFYRKNLSVGNVGEFLTAASNHQAKPLQGLCKLQMGELLEEKPQHAGLITPQNLVDILEQKTKTGIDATRSKSWSRAVYINMSHHEKSLTKPLYAHLTTDAVLPAIDASVALRLLALDAKYTSVPPGTYSSLQKRCVKAITEDWATFEKGFSSSQAVSGALQQLPSHVLADILMKSMTQNSLDGE